HLRIRELQAEVEEQLRLRALAEQQLAQSLDRAVAVVGPDGAVQFCTTLARALLDRWFGTETAPGGLPEGLRVWIAQGWARAAAAPMRVATAQGELTVRLLADAAVPESGVLLFEEQAVASHAALRRLGLTPREAEVLHWLSEGK